MCAAISHSYAEIITGKFQNR